VARSPSSGVRIPAMSVAVAALVVAAVVILILFLWQLAGVIILVFAAVLVAILLHGVAELIEQHTPLRNPWSLLVACVGIAALLAAFGVFLGTQISAQIRNLVSELPALWSSLEDALGIQDLASIVAERLRGFLNNQESIANVAGLTLNVFDILLSFFLVIIAGIYIAARPQFYRDGLLLLFPTSVRPKVAEATIHAGNALRYWLIGQLIAMLIIGVLITIGLFVLGVPSALALGFIAGILDFVPIVGPIVAAVPAVLLGFSVTPATALWVIGLYVVIQQVEGNLVQPMVQRRAVDLPPALTLFALVAFGVLFGPLGVIFATPLAVTALVAVKQLYVRDTLGEETSVPGETDPKPAKKPRSRSRPTTQKTPGD
jgi:predicted PurR-regulated permease PerM